MASALPDTLPVYQAAQQRLFNLVDTKLWIRFDWQKKHCLGIAQITATPVARERNVLSLDAVGFDDQFSYHFRWQIEIQL